MQALSAVTTFLFTDIEGSTRLWEDEPERMRLALASHDMVARAAVESNHGTVVKMIGDGMHAVFDDPLAAVNAIIAIQSALADISATSGVLLRVRCGLHLGAVERRDNDYFGSPVNRAARIMSAAHGGQILLSQGHAVELLAGLAILGTQHAGAVHDVEYTIGRQGGRLQTALGNSIAAGFWNSYHSWQPRRSIGDLQGSADDN